MSENLAPAQLTDQELGDTIVSTGAHAARLYAQEANTDEVDARLDALVEEYERRRNKPANQEAAMET